MNKPFVAYLKTDVFLFKSVKTLPMVVKRNPKIGGCNMLTSLLLG